VKAAQTVLVAQPEGTIPSWEGRFTVNVQETDCGWGLRHTTVIGCCEHGDALPVSIKRRELADHVSYCQLHGVPHAVANCTCRLRPVTHSWSVRWRVMMSASMTSRTYILSVQHWLTWGKYGGSSQCGCYEIVYLSEKTRCNKSFGSWHTEPAVELEESGLWTREPVESNVSCNVIQSRCT
jgi:hypothetical protein